MVAEVPFFFEYNAWGFICFIPFRMHDSPSVFGKDISALLYGSCGPGKGLIQTDLFRKNEAMYRMVAHMLFQ